MKPCPHEFVFNDCENHETELTITLRCELCRLELIYNPKVDDIMNELEIWDTYKPERE